MNIMEQIQELKRLREQQEEMDRQHPILALTRRVVLLIARGLLWILAMMAILGLAGLMIGYTVKVILWVVH